MSDVSIGTVSSEVRLNLSSLQADVSEVKATLASLAASLASAVEGLTATVTANAEAAVRAQEQAARASAERIAAQAKAQQEAALAAASKLGGQLQMAGALAVGALGMAVKSGMDFETTLTNVANNTTMTTADIAQMTDAVKELGRSSGADLSQLAEGFMHASNFGFTAAESTKILTEAMKSAVSTGGNVGKTTEILANVMHEFSIRVSDAGRAMNVLHLAAAEGNMTLEQLVEAGGPAFAMAANLGVKFTEVSAAMAALTKHGFTAAEAATQVRNILSHIAEPASKTRDLLEDLSKTTGVDLVRDFSLAGLHAKGMAGILNDVKEAARKAHMDVSDLTMKLVPAMRGGIGAMALAGTAAKDFTTELHHMDEAITGKVDPTMTAFQRQQATLQAEVNKARNEMQLMGSDIEKALLPAVRPLIQAVRDAAGWFSSLSPTAKSAAAQLAAFAGAAALVTGTVLKTITMLAELKTAMAALGGLKIGGAAAGEAGGVTLTGASLGIARLLKFSSLPLTIAGMMTATTSGGDGTLHGKQAEVSLRMLNDHVRNSAKALAEWRAMSSAARLEYVKNTFGANLFGQPSKGRDQYDQELRDTLKANMDALGRRRSKEHVGKAGAGGNDADRLMAAWKKAHPDSDDGSGGGGGSGNAPGDAKRAIEEVADKLYALSHSDFDVRMRTAFREMNEEIGNGVPKAAAFALYLKQIAGIRSEKANADITARITDIGGLKKAEQDEQEATRKALAEQNALVQAGYDAQMRDMLTLKSAESEEHAAMERYWADYRAEMEETFRAQIEGASLAAQTQREELERTRQYYAENPDVLLAANETQEAREAQQQERERTRQYHAENPDIGKRNNTMVQQYQQGLKTMAQGVQDILGGAFDKLFHGDTKHLFQDMLKQFEDMLAQMAAKALASGIVNMLTGGSGGFLGGILNSLGGGFDDGNNDRTARHWGFDFASMFTQGVSDHANRRMAAVSASGGGGASHVVNIAIHGPVVRHEADINALSLQVARHVQNGLRVRPGTGR